jgi:boron transporter
MLVIAFLFKILSRSALFHRHVRRFCADYGMPLALIASSAMAYWGRFHTAGPQTLPVGAAFKPANGRSWLVPFWQLEGKWVALALPFGFILWVLFFFDHNVSVCRPFLFFVLSKTDERGCSGPFAVADLTGIPVPAPKACWLSL